MFLKNSLAQNNCLGTWENMYIGSHMPFAKVKCGKSEGLFIIDFATDTTAVDIYGFNGGIPKPVSSSNNNIYNLRFQGNNYEKYFSLQDFTNIQADGIREAGILGTDILSQKIYTLDYDDKKIYIVNLNSSFCHDSDLYSKGFMPLTAKGYYSNNISTLKDPKTNIPTVPIKIDGALAVAQLDPGFDDLVYHHSININRSFFNLLKMQGIEIEEIETTKQTNLTTCAIGYNDTLVQCKLKKPYAFQIINTDNNPIYLTSDVTVFLKSSPFEAKSCGGISTWDVPGAQIGASFFIDFKKIIFDPFSSRVWIKVGK